MALRRRSVKPSLESSSRAAAAGPPSMPLTPSTRAPSRGAPPLRLAQYAWIAGAVLVAAAALHWLGPILTPFVVGAILAYLGQPLVQWAARHRVPRALGTLAVIVLMLLFILALILVLVPLVQSEFAMLIQRLPALAATLQQRLSPWLLQNFDFALQLDIETLRGFITEHLDLAQGLWARLFLGFKTGGLVLLKIVINLVLIPVVMFYLLRDWTLLIRRIDELTPRRWLPMVRGMAGQIDDVLGEFFYGQVLVMAVLATYYALALWAVGLQSAFPIGILTGLLVFIPYVGYGLGLTLAVLAALLQFTGWPGFIAVLAVYGVGQLLENYLLVPWLVGDRIGLHPLVVIFVLLAFGQLFGFVGVLMALPVSAVLLVGLRHLRAAYLDSTLYGA